MAVTRQDVLSWLEDLARVYAGNKQRLTDLDAAIGDADHGSNLDRGFTAVKSELAASPPPDICSALGTTATVLIRTVGGASGPLYGTFFLRAGAACAGKAELEAAGVIAIFKAGVEGVRQRGKANPGDKTMLDALMPAVDAMDRALDAGLGLSQILERGAAAAEAGMFATIPLEARKGRASYLGARSIGHQDPGATSSYLLVESAFRCWR